MPVDLILYALIAAGLVFWLRGVIGTRQEGDDSPSLRNNLPDLDAVGKPTDPTLPVATLGIKSQDNAVDQIERVKKDKAGVIGIDNKTAEAGLTSIIDADREFDLKFFLGAAQDVFVMVVEAFAEGDRDALQDLLAPEVYSAFEEALDNRQSREESFESEIHAIHEARIIRAKLDKKMAYITVKFVAEQASVLRNKDGDIVSGHPERSTRMTDIWTFGRDIKSRDPRWLVHKTHGDFEGDNDMIPDTHAHHAQDE